MGNTHDEWYFQKILDQNTALQDEATRMKVIIERGEERVETKTKFERDTWERKFKEMAKERDMLLASFNIGHDVCCVENAKRVKELLDVIRSIQWHMGDPERWDRDIRIEISEALKDPVKKKWAISADK